MEKVKMGSGGAQSLPFYKSCQEGDKLGSKLLPLLLGVYSQQRQLVLLR